ncbi:MAG: PilZ domain-containing protein [Candidatus Binatia bacterium]
MQRPLCPKCSREYVVRVSRIGLGERLISLLYVYPFRCQLCSYRFKLAQWGVTYTRIEEDRREYQRLPGNFPIAFDSDAINGQGVVLEISMGGCTFHTEAQVTEGNILRMRLDLPNGIPPVNVEAAIVRNVQPGRVGVEFLRIEHGQRGCLKRFIRGLIVGP